MKLSDLLTDVQPVSGRYVLGLKPGLSESSVKDLKGRIGKARDSYTCQVLRKY